MPKKRRMCKLSGNCKNFPREAAHWHHTLFSDFVYESSWNKYSHGAKKKLPWHLLHKLQCRFQCHPSSQDVDTQNPQIYPFKIACRKMKINNVSSICSSETRAVDQHQTLDVPIDDGTCYQNWSKLFSAQNCDLYRLLYLKSKHKTPHGKYSGKNPLYLGAGALKYGETTIRWGVLDVSL